MVIQYRAMLDKELCTEEVLWADSVEIKVNPTFVSVMFTDILGDMSDLWAREYTFDNINI